MLFLLLYQYFSVCLSSCHEVAGARLCLAELINAHCIWGDINRQTVVEECLDGSVTVEMDEFLLLTIDIHVPVVLRLVIGKVEHFAVRLGYLVAVLQILHCVDEPIVALYVLGLADVLGHWIVTGPKLYGVEHQCIGHTCEGVRR